MDWDDEYDNGYSDMGNASHRDNFVSDKGSSEAGFDPMDITNPVSAYFFLSDDTQDEISGSDKKKMKCLSCGRRFIGEFYDSCPKCFSSDTEEVVSTIDGDEEISVRANMKCLEGVRLILRSKLGKMTVDEKRPEMFPAIAQDERSKCKNSLTAVNGPSHA